MRTRPTLLRVLTPPPIGPDNVLQGGTQKAITFKALGLHLSKSVPMSAERSCPFRLSLITIHPSQPLVAYLMIPEGPEKKRFPKTLVVQHVKTRSVIWTMTLGELASMMYKHEVIIKGSSESATAKRTRILKDLGEVQRIDFFDPATLYWSGNGTASGPQDQEIRWSYLILQMQTRAVILNLRQDSISIATNSPRPANTVFKPIVANIAQDSVGAIISSNALPVSKDNILIGTTDGSLKLYNWKANAVVQSKQLLSIKTDMIVQILATNKFSTPEQYSKNKRFAVCLTRKGAAVLIALMVTQGVVHDISSPIARFEGGTVPNSASPKQDEDSVIMEHTYSHYCGFRNVLLWTALSKTKTKLLAWDLGRISVDDAKSKKKIDAADPLLVMQFSYEAPHTVLPAWLHESMPMESMACAAVTKEGDFQLLVAPLYSSGSTMKHAYSAFAVLSSHLDQIIKRDLMLPEEREIHLKVHSIHCPPLRDSSIIYFGTNYGILMVKMADGNLVQVPGTRHAHLSANFGGLGKAVFSAKGPEISYGMLEPPAGPLAVDPIGYMDVKNTVNVYESPPPLHLPPEIHKRPVRLPPLFLLSPSRSFLCCFWKEEMRYEILHMPSMMERVTSRSQTGKSPMIASGNGVVSFAWIGDEDVFCVLYNPEQDLALKVGVDLSIPHESLGKEFGSEITKLRELKKLRDAASGKKFARGGRVLGAAAKLQSLKGLQEIGKGTGKVVAGIGKKSVGTLKKTAKGTAGAVKQTGRITMKTTQLAVGGGKKVARFGLKGLVGGKKKAKDAEGSLAQADNEDDGETSVSTSRTLGAISIDQSVSTSEKSTSQLDRKFPWVEMRNLVEVTGTDRNATGATPATLGELTLRSGNRNPPTVLFGGPVLCVASKADEADEGLAYFYTKKKGSTDESASEYVSSGPAFPCPDLVVWDDDGRLCAVVIQSKVTIYLSEEPNFTMLGTIGLGTPSDIDIQVTSARFLHGALYCTTRSAVQVVFLGDLDGGVCHLDLFTLASSEVALLPSKSIATDQSSWMPATIPMPLNYPAILGYQNGALLISTVSGVQAIPLGSPLLRIGALLGAGHQQKAEKWFDAVPEDDHESLANFLERRGAPALAIELSGLSLETMVDMCMRHGYVDRLEELVDMHGVAGLRMIDMGQGVSTDAFGPVPNATSVVVSVGAYLLSQGRVDVVKRLAADSFNAGTRARRDAFMLAGLMLSVDEGGSKQMMREAVQGDDDGWFVGSFIRDHVF